MARPIVFELCAETLEACIAAETGGADRIELCSNLSEDGLTPDDELLQEALKRCRLPFHMMLRPRGGDFNYTTAGVDLMCRQLEKTRSLAVAGVVCGVLHADRTVDIDRMRKLTALAGHLPVTFHRALDTTPDIFQALEDVIASGCRRVLTSGGAVTAIEGARIIAALVQQAGDRIEVAVGSGLRLENAAALVNETGAFHFHGTVRVPGTNHVDPAYVRTVKEALRSALRSRTVQRTDPPV
jgi:copper homeostasis protein